MPPQALETLERDTEFLKRYISNHSNVSHTMKLLTYYKRMKMMKILTTNTWNMVMTSGSPHETWISNHFGVPTFVINYQRILKRLST